mgnify:CR=1 FL=1
MLTSPRMKPKSFLSTPSARRATFSCQPKGAKPDISIHALREEGDSHHAQSAAAVVISIHALREEGDRRRSAIQSLVNLISIHALREEGDFIFSGYPHYVRISIHALREEGDYVRIRGVLQSSQFLSTPSARRATYLPILSRVRC